MRNTNEVMIVAQCGMPIALKKNKVWRGKWRSTRTKHQRFTGILFAWCRMLPLPPRSKLCSREDMKKSEASYDDTCKHTCKTKRKKHSMTEEHGRKIHISILQEDCEERNRWCVGCWRWRRMAMKDREGGKGGIKFLLLGHEVVHDVDWVNQST